MNKSQKLVDSIIKGIQDKKGSGIVVADLTQTDGAVCSYFIICQGNSPTQVEAIAGSVGDYVREAEGEKPVSCIGLGLSSVGRHRLRGCDGSYLPSRGEGVL